jgi:hypothetical protein
MRDGGLLLSNFDSDD